MLIISSDPRFEFWRFMQHEAKRVADVIDPIKFNDPAWWRDGENHREALRGEDNIRAHKTAMALRTDTLEYLASNAAEFLDAPLHFLIQGLCGPKDRAMVVKRTYALGARALAMRLDTAPALPPADNLTPEEAYRYVSALMKSAVAEVDRRGGETEAFKTVLATLNPKAVQRYRAIYLPSPSGPPQTVNAESDPELTDTEQDIVNALRKAGTRLKGPELAKAAGFSDNSSHFRGLLSSLKKRGKLSHNETGYGLPGWP